MRRLPDCEPVRPAALVEACRALRDGGWRLVTASCLRRPGRAFTVLYHFERDERLRHLRVELESGDGVPSIGEVYGGAFLVENEMKELQGLPVEGLVIDYGGRLYRDFDGPEGFVVVPPAPGGTPAGPALFDSAAELRLDACVPITPNGREVRAPGSRVPPAEGEGA